jgi:hypothetical protein
VFHILMLIYMVLFISCSLLVHRNTIDCHTLVLDPVSVLSLIRTGSFFGYLDYLHRCSCCMWVKTVLLLFSLCLLLVAHIFASLGRNYHSIEAGGPSCWFSFTHKMLAFVSWVSSCRFWYSERLHLDWVLNFMKFPFCIFSPLLW